MHELLTPMLSDNRIDNITEDIFDHDRIGALSRDEYERLQNEFGLLAAPFVGAAPADYNFAAAVQDSLTLMRLAELSVFFGTDAPLARHLLVRLSGLIGLLGTVYRNDTLDAYIGMGSVIAFKEFMRINHLLTSDTDGDRQTFIVNVMNGLPVTNHTLAVWNDAALRRYGLPRKREVRNAVKAMSLFDSLVGSGVETLLLKHAREETEKKLLAFRSIGLDALSDSILAFYDCRTGNEKKRFLADIPENVMKTPILEVVDAYLNREKP